MAHKRHSKKRSCGRRRGASRNMRMKMRMRMRKHKHMRMNGGAGMELGYSDWDNGAQTQINGGNPVVLPVSKYGVPVGGVEIAQPEVNRMEEQQKLQADVAKMNQGGGGRSRRRSRRAATRRVRRRMNRKHNHKNGKGKTSKVKRTMSVRRRMRNMRGGFIGQELINIGQSIGYELDKAYGGFMGHQDPVNPSVLSQNIGGDNIKRPLMPDLKEIYAQANRTADAGYPPA